MLSLEAFEFIKINSDQDPVALAFKTRSFDPETTSFLLLQIKQKQKTNKKLPTWAQNHKLLFASDLNAEQCSAEACAAYKAGLFSGKVLADLSGGLGIDTFYFSKTFDRVNYCETHQDTVNVVRHNFKELASSNIQIHHTDGLNWLTKQPQHFDLIYLDPDRRPDQQRVYDFEACQPNVLDNLDLLVEKADKVLIKASPMIDLDMAIKQLKKVSKIWVLSIKNECKEVLFLVEKSPSPISITAVELPQKELLQGSWSDKEFELPTTEIKHYLYDPWVCVRKASLQQLLANKHQLSATAALSIYTSDRKIEGFMGRVFKKIEVLQASAKVLKKLGINRANIIAKGLKQDANALHLQLKINRGGDDFLIAFAQSNDKIGLIWCKKIV
jgi:16S rRNA G966 N2-methylase RsmD